jgi:hypothetical protein
MSEEKEITKEENPKDHPAWAEFVAWFEELYLGNHPEDVPFLNIQNWEPYLAGYNTGHNAGVFETKEDYSAIIKGSFPIIDLVQSHPDYFNARAGDSCLLRVYEKLREIMTEEGYSE